MKLKFTSNSKRRLTQIVDYYDRQGNPRKGDRIVRTVQDEAKKLEKHPRLGPEEDNLRHLGQGHRYLLIKPFYKLLYLIAKPFIFITDIFDTRQNPDKMRP
jgi:plasmid stabilization system protein ParE